MIKIDSKKQKKLVKYYALGLGIMFLLGALNRFLNGELIYGIFLLLAAFGTSLSLYKMKDKSFITMFMGVVIFAIGNKAKIDFGTDVGIYIGIIVFFIGMILLIKDIKR